MSRDELRQIIFKVLGNIAPEADLPRLDPDVNMREELDLDSVDALNFLVGLHKELKIDIPEKDYGRTTTLNGCLDYLETVLKRA